MNLWSSTYVYRFLKNNMKFQLIYLKTYFYPTQFAFVFQEFEFTILDIRLITIKAGRIYNVANAMGPCEKGALKLIRDKERKST